MTGVLLSIRPTAMSQSLMEGRTFCFSLGLEKTNRTSPDRTPVGEETCVGSQAFLGCGDKGDCELHWCYVVSDLELWP